MKEHIELHVQNICCHYSDKNVDVVSDQKKAEEWDDLIHEIKYVKQRKCWKASTESFWIDQKDDQLLHDIDESWQKFQPDELNAAFAHIWDED